MEEEPEYFCDCPICGSIKKRVSRRTYLRHKLHREPVSSSSSQFSADFRRYLGPRADGPSLNKPSLEPSPQQPLNQAGSSTGVVNDSSYKCRRIEEHLPQHNPTPSPETYSSDPVDPSEEQNDFDLEVPQFSSDRDPHPPDTSNEDPPGPQQYPGSGPEDPENEDPPNPDHADNPPIAPVIEDLRISLEFVEALKNASLDNEDEALDEDVIHRLLNPPTEPLDISDPYLRLSIDLFLSNGSSSDDTYSKNREAILRCHPEDEILTFARVKRCIAELSGVVSLRHDMCPNTCIAYTGPFSVLESCPYCSTPRYDPIQLASSNGAIKKPQQQFYTIPIGPQLQALWRSPNGAEQMRYRERVTEQILKDIGYIEGQPIPSPESYNDIFYGSDYLQAVIDKKIQAGDMVLMLSIDGAQLYQHKVSDCWMYIWVICNHSPDHRYQKKFALPGGFFPGPHKPKNVDSFSYPGLHHMNAINKNGGLKVWDAARNTVFSSKLFLALATADTPGLVYFSGLVGHHGKSGCRMYCALKGRHEHGRPHYYPARLKPNHYSVEGCDHPDVHLSDFLFEESSARSTRYLENLKYVLNSPNPTQFSKRRLATGITKPSIFLGLQPDCMFGIPNIFSLDIMHLCDINLPTLHLDLWRGTMDCDKDTDSRAAWDWAVLQGDVWKAHGREVAATKPYLPGSFDRPPRNIAEKINSGYKAWEYLIYFFMLGPGLLYGILPPKYWRHYCKLVCGQRILHQQKIETTKLQYSHLRLSEWSTEFEEIYCQRRADRLHFVRPCVHSISHMPEEATRVGPASYASQWCLERTIGNLGEEIKQHSNPYINLSERGLRRSQVNALYAMAPDLDPSADDKLPRGSRPLGDGFVLLRAMDNCSRPVRPCEGSALRIYIESVGGEVPDEEDWCPFIVRWARLRLPNGQITRTLWKEALKPLEQTRMARNVKFQSETAFQFGEVQFFFQLRINDTIRTLALVSLWSAPHQALLRESWYTIWYCTYQGDAALKVIDVKTIQAVVAMVPRKMVLPIAPSTDFSPGNLVLHDGSFVGEKPGLALAHMGGMDEEDEDRPNDN